MLLVGEGEAADAKARLIEAAGGVVVRESAPDVRIAFVALDDAGEAAAAAVRLKAAGLLVNVVDRPALCDFTIPAIVDRSPVLVAIGTGGASASLSKALRERLEALLPERLGALATAIFASRIAVAQRHPTIEARRRFWDAALAPGGRLDPLGGGEPVVDLDDKVGAADTLTEIVLTSLDADDLTLRQLRALNQADVLFYGPGVPAGIIDRARRDAERREFEVVPEPLPPRRVVIVTMAG